MIALSAQDGESEGIYLLGIGTPPAWYYNDQLMDEVTDLGKGGYYYVDTEAEAESRFSFEKLPGVFQVAARDVQLAVTLPAGFVVEEFTGEEMGNTSSEVEPQHLSFNDQMLYDLDLLDCSPDSVSPDHEFLFTVEWDDPASGAEMIDTLTMTVAEMLAVSHRELVKASALVSFAQAFESVNDLSSSSNKASHLQGVIDELTSATVAFPTDPDLPEVLELAQAWQGMY
jgi:Ca-activated chloride channel family protein